MSYIKKRVEVGYERRNEKRRKIHIKRKKKKKKIKASRKMRVAGILA